MQKGISVFLFGKIMIKKKKLVMMSCGNYVFRIVEISHAFVEHINKNI